MPCNGATALLGWCLTTQPTGRAHSGKFCSEFFHPLLFLGPRRGKPRRSRRVQWYASEQPSQMCRSFLRRANPVPGSFWPRMCQSSELHSSISQRAGAYSCRLLMRTGCFSPWLFFRGKWGKAAFAVRSWKFPLSDNSAGRQHSLLSPLDCLPAKAGRAVNGGAYAPFILTVDWLGWLCYEDIVISSALTAKGTNQTDCVWFLHLRYRDLAYSQPDDPTKIPWIDMQIPH